MFHSFFDFGHRNTRVLRMFLMPNTEIKCKILFFHKKTNLKNTIYFPHEKSTLLTEWKIGKADMSGSLFRKCEV